MSKFKIRPVKFGEDDYSVQYSLSGFLWFRDWYYLSYWDKKEQSWEVRTFNKKRAEQVCRQLTDFNDVVAFQAETYK